MEGVAIFFGWCLASRNGVAISTAMFLHCVHGKTEDSHVALWLRDFALSTQLCLRIAHPNQKVKCGKPVFHLTASGPWVSRLHAVRARSAKNRLELVAGLSTPDVVK